MDCLIRTTGTKFPTGSADDGSDKQSNDPYRDDLVEEEESVQQGTDDLEFVDQASEYDTESHSEPTIV